MRKTLAISMMLAAALGLAACDKKSEDKAQDAAAHSEQAQKDMAKAQDKVNDAAKENADAAKAQAESNEAAAKEATPATAGFTLSGVFNPAGQLETSN
eukprot:gene11035-12860_t